MWEDISTLGDSKQGQRMSLFFFFFCQIPRQDIHMKQNKRSNCFLAQTLLPHLLLREEEQTEKQFRHFLGLLPSRDVTTHHFLCVYFQPRTTLQTKKQHVIHGLQIPGGLCNCKEISPQEQTASEFCFFSMTCKFWLTSDFLSDKGN